MASHRPHLHQRHNTAHDIFLEFHKHRPQSLRKIKEVNEKREGRDDYPASNVPMDFEMFQHVMKTGVIYATSRARGRGFDADDPEWANMGQGAPETGPLPGAPSRNFHMNIEDALLEYAPVTGLKELREKVANYYNHLYRQGKDSQYTFENVCIVPGGRAGLTRCMAAMGNTQVGYFTPDYTAYQQSLGLFVRITPSPLLHKDGNEAIMPSEEFKFQAVGRGLGAMLWSNPANPTGMSLEGKELDAYVEAARELNIALIADEFYSHYYYDGDAVDPENGGADDDSNWPKTVSSAAYIKDVDIDPIIIINGLTKNWRCPGFRICWIVAPKPIVDMLGSAGLKIAIVPDSSIVPSPTPTLLCTFSTGSFLDGGANAPLQKLALPLMDLDFIRRDTWALQRTFKKKRDFLLAELARIGITVKWMPTATFYVWADISALPSPINDCLVFLEECVKYKVICVPGVFFDINPRNIRNIKQNKCINFVRFSYGPPMSNLEKGIQQMEKMIQNWKENPGSVAMYERASFGDDSES